MWLVLLLLFLLTLNWLALTFTKCKAKTKKVTLFPEIDRMKNFYHLPARIVECVLSEYAFLISRNNKQTTTKIKTKKAKQTKEEKKISPGNRLKNKFAATWVKNFLVTRVSGNKSIIFFGPINVNFKYFLRFFSICNNVFVYALLLTCLIFLFTSLK